MGEAIKFIASIAPTQAGLAIHGLEGYRMLVDIPNDELAAVMQLALVRGKALEFEVREADTQPARAKSKAKRKREIPEWGDDDANDNT